jgi:signal transduction histidine kinase/CheY-like chemotaxis protein
MASGIQHGTRLKRPISITASLTAQVLLLLCTLGMIWGGIWFHLETDYRRTVRDAVDRSASLAETLEDNMSRSATVLDTALRNSRELYILDPSDFKIGPWMRDKAVLMKIALQMSITDATGTVVKASGDNGPPPVNIADREHFRVQAAATDDRLFISAPVIGRTSGKLSIQFTRRIVNRDGGFAGVAVVSFDPLIIDQFRDGTRLNGGFTMLIGNDGIIRAAQPETTLVGARFPDSAILEKIIAAGDGPLPNGTEKVVGDHSIVSYRKVPGYPLFIAAGFTGDTVFTLYGRERRIDMAAGGVLSGIVLFIGVAAIRDRRRLTRFHEALTLTMDNISQGILMIDARRRMPVVNRRVAELLGLPEQLARPGAGFDKMVEWQDQHGEFGAVSDGARRVATLTGTGGGDPKTGFYERTRANGTVLEVRTTILPDGSAVRTFTDVTERKRIEQEMSRARDEAEAGVRARTEFLAIISHEIRTPMNGIIGAAGLLRDMRLDSEQTEYVRIIRESSDHLSSLIQNILDFSQLDSGRLELEQIAFDPRALLRGTTAMLNGQAHAKGLTLAVRVGDDVPERLSGDASRLRQILVNLIGNGIKFTQSGGVTVEAGIGAAGDQAVTLGIAVTDTGIGIDPDSKQKLFSAFTQIDSSISRRFSGTGLGLAICERLVTLMGGEIEVDSVVGQGSTFRFSIELQRAAAAKHNAPVAGTPAPIQPLKVLLAEDNLTNRHVAIRMLARMGHMVDAVEDGALAISAAAEKDYDVILMDVMMPEVDGLTATRTIRAGTPPRCNVRIVGLTANALDSDRAACETAGMDGFVTKPVTLERLRAVLEQTDLPIDPFPDLATAPLDALFLSQLADEIDLSGVLEALHAFLEDAPGRMAAIRRAMTDGTILTIRREAHALSGAARNVGLTRLGEAASALQDICGKGLPDETAIEMVAAALRETLPLATAWAEAHENLATATG